MPRIGNPTVGVLQYLIDRTPLSSEYSSRQVHYHLREERNTRPYETHAKQGEDSRDLGEICTL